MKKNLIKIASQVIAWALFIFMPFFFFSPKKPPVDIHLAFMFYPWLFLIAFYYTNYYILIPRFLFKRKVALYVFISLSCFIAFMASSEFLARISHHPTPELEPASLPVIGRLGNIVFFLFTFIISTGISVINELYNISNKEQQAEVERSRAKLAFLQAQVNPHFLFNTLYSIYQLSVNKSDKAPEAILQLSDMMRFVLTESRNNLVSLRTEIDYINKYIDLQKLRISDKTHVNFVVKGEGVDNQIAPLLLIPFVENAFKYGVSSHMETIIGILLLIKEDSIEFSVSNNKFNSLNENERNNIGLRNVKSRLQLLYPESHELLINEQENHFGIYLKIVDL